MKSIKSTLRLVKKNLEKFSRLKNCNIKAALIGGQAIISQGVPRTTMDVDLCVVITDKNQKEIDPENLFIFLKQKLLDFNVEYKPFTNISDPLKHSLIRIAHIEGECPTIDILFAHYGWEIEALENAEDLGLAFPCFSKPYLVAMKLQAGGLKDEYDILNLLSVMGQKEKEKALNLSKIVHKDKRFRKLKMLQHS